MLKEHVLNISFFNYLIICITVVDENVICLVYTPIKKILINKNYICIYSKYSPSSDNFCKHLNVIGCLTQRYCLIWAGCAWVVERYF